MGTHKTSSFFERSKLRFYNTSENTIFDYHGTHHVRVLKRFESPADPYGDRQASDLLTLDYNRLFHLRFYIPKSGLIRVGQKIRDIVVMFNGLNEIEHFDLYDILGQYLSEQGIAAVLLPTPFHLNRSGFYKAEGKHRFKHFSRPHEFLFENPMLMYYNCKQSMLDGDLLIRKLRQEQTDPSDLGFYESLFDADLRVSIFGFSLGGLRALASFVRQPNKFHTCIVFNSGVELSLLNTSSINIQHDRWQRFVGDLTSKASERVDAESDRQLQGFNEVFLGAWPTHLRQVLKDYSQKVLFVLSGADPIMKPELLKSIAFEGHGLTVLQIAGVGHIPTIDPQWSPWLDRVFQFIIRFLNHTGRKLWSRQAIVDEVGELISGSSYVKALRYSDNDFQMKDLQQLVGALAPDRRDELLNLFYSSMAYYPSFREVLNSFARKSRSPKNSGMTKRRKRPKRKQLKKKTMRP